MANQAPTYLAKDSVGLVKPQVMRFTEDLTLECGQTLSEYQLIYETYGTLNADKSNGILICHALSGDHHAAGYHNEDDRKPGWWDTCIGPGKPIDTTHFFVVCSNNIGGCGGSTGPTSVNPKNGQSYGPDFPIVTVKDWVRCQVRLSDSLGIKQWAAIIGGSLGGMQVIQWAIDYPNHLRHAVVIAATPLLSAQNIAFNEVARQAILTDPEFHGGYYKNHHVIPKQGLRLARMLGHITYLSDDSMHSKFGRELRTDKLKYSFDVEFQVESYLRYQSESFVENQGYDANTYLLMTKALDYFDPARDYDQSLSAALAEATANFLVISFTSDWRFPPQRSQQLVTALLANQLPTCYCKVESTQGHDAFLLPIPHYLEAFYAYMDRLLQEISHDDA